ncbi:hypothetical protein V8E55_011905 [Tylopilus felleus]
MGTRRLPFPAVLIRLGAAADVCCQWTNQLTCPGPPFTQGDSHPRDCRRTRKGLHVLCMHKIHTFRKYIVSPCIRFQRHGMCEMFRSRRHHFDDCRPCSTIYPLCVRHPI